MIARTFRSALACAGYFGPIFRSRITTCPRNAAPITSANHSSFQHFSYGREPPAWLCLSDVRADKPKRSSSSTVNSVFGFGLLERARNSSMRFLKSASYSSSIICLDLGMIIRSSFNG